MNHDLDQESQQLITIEVQQRVQQFEEEFIANVSHELRTPLTSIKLAIIRLKEEKDETKRKVYLEIIETQTQREIDYINNLLNYKDKLNKIK